MNREGKGAKEMGPEGVGGSMRLNHSSRGMHCGEQGKTRAGGGGECWGRGKRLRREGKGSWLRNQRRQDNETRRG